MFKNSRPCMNPKGSQSVDRPHNNRGEGCKYYMQQPNKSLSTSVKGHCLALPPPPLPCRYKIELPVAV